MARFLLRRFVAGLIALFVLMTLLFFMMHAIMPGDYTSQFALALSAEEQQEMRRQLGLDLPLGQRYLMWLGEVAQGRLGYSYQLTLQPGVTNMERLPVSAILAERWPPTVLVFGLGLALASLIGHWLGRVTAWRGPSLLGDGVNFAVIAIYALFPPALVFFLQLALVKQLKWLPSWSEFNFRFQRDFPDLSFTSLSLWMVLALFGAMAMTGVLAWALRRFARRALSGLAFALIVAALSVAVWHVLGFGPAALELLRAAAIPLIAVVALSTGEMMAISRASVTDTLHEQYVMTARAKGLDEGRVRDHHAVPNALLPIITRAGISLPYFLGGLAIVEASAQWPGIGGAVFRATVDKDIPAALGLLTVIGLLTLIMRLALDVAYALLEPRVRFTAAPK